MSAPLPKAPDLDALPLMAASVTRQDRVRADLLKIAGYLSEGGIPNARYEDLRGGVLRAISECWKAGVPNALDGISRGGQDRRLMFEDGTLQNAAYRLENELHISDYDGLPVVDRVATRLAKVLAKPHPPEILAALAEGPARMAEIKVVSDAMNWLRERRVKRAPPGSAPPGPELPKATREAQASVRTRMKEILGDLRERYAAIVVEHVGTEAGRMEKACATFRDRLAAHAEAMRIEREAGRRVRFTEADEMRRERVRIANLHHTARHLVDYDPNSYETKRHPDGEARAAEFGRQEAERVFHLWTERNVEKLSPIVEAKGGIRMDVVSGKASPYGVETVLKVAFPDGSRFVFTNSVEFATSPLGKDFLRFPARFHDVYLADGKRLRGTASEARVKEAMVGPSEEETPSVPAP